jgi:hypothetical protein
MLPSCPSTAAGNIGNIRCDSITVCAAEAHLAIVLHHDRDYDVIAEVTGHMVGWVVARGSAQR